MKAGSELRRLLSLNPSPPLDSTFEILGSTLIYAALGAVVTYTILSRLGPSVSIRETLAIPYIAAAGLGGLRYATGISSFYQSVPAQPDATAEHKALRLWLTWWAAGLAAFSTLVGALMVLIFGRGEGFVLVFSADLPVTTILAFALLSRYTAKSFAADISKLDQTTRESLQGIGDNILASSREQIASFRSSSTAMVEETRRASEEQTTVLRELARVMKGVSDYLESQLEVTKEVEAQGKMATELQVRAIEDARAREEVRKATEARVAEEERIRLMPRLAAELRSTGPIIHHLVLDIQDAGPMGQNLEFLLFVGGKTVYRGSAGEIRPQGLLKFDIGDVTKYGTSAALSVVGRVSDALSRQYQFSISFTYSRDTGLFGLTKSISIAPTGMISLALTPIAQN